MYWTTFFEKLKFFFQCELPILLATVLSKVECTVQGEKLNMNSLFIGIREKSRENVLQIRASALAFSMLLSMFPALLFIFSVIAYLPIPNFQVELLVLIKQIVPASSANIVKNTLIDIIEHKNGEILSIGFITSMYFASNGVLAVIRSFNQSMQCKEHRNFLQLRLLAFLIMLAASFFMFLAINIILISEIAIEMLYSTYNIINDLDYYLLKILTWLLLFLLIACSIAICYTFAPAKKLKLNFFSLGVWVATVLIVLSIVVVSYYFSTFVNMNKIYGSIGGFVVFIILLSYSTLMFLFGFEINTVLDTAISSKLKAK